MMRPIVLSLVAGFSIARIGVCVGVALPVVLLTVLLSAPPPLVAAAGHSSSQGKAERLRVQVVRSYPHDRGAFTQGLLLHDGALYESTGLVGRSTLRQVDLATGRVVRRVDVPPPIFAEGLALVGDRLFQLTWQNNQVLLYDPRNFQRAGQFSYGGEGWGLCYDGRHLVMSDGSNRLTFRGPSDFSTVRTAVVTMDGVPLGGLNELECADGVVYANVWMQEFIVRIDPGTGRVLARVDAANLLSPLERIDVDVLNGIAYDPSDRTYLITGKLWPKLFRVRFVK